MTFKKTVTYFFLSVIALSFCIGAKIYLYPFINPARENLDMNGYTLTNVGGISVDDNLLFSVLKATSVAIGAGSTNNHTFGIGMGYNTYNNYSYGIGIGRVSRDNHTYGIGMGHNTYINHTAGIGIGKDAYGNYEYGIGLGGEARNNHTYGIGIGKTAVNNQNYSIGIGYYATTNSHTDAVAIGKNSSSTADNAWAIGNACVNNSTGTIKINLPIFLTGNLTVGKAISLGYEVLSDSGTITVSSGTVVNCTKDGIMSVTLPTAVGNQGLYFKIKKSGTAGAVSLITNAAETIDGTDDPIYVDAQYDFLGIVSDNANWLVVDRYIQ